MSVWQALNRESTEPASLSGPADALGLAAAGHFGRRVRRAAAIYAAGLAAYKAGKGASERWRKAREYTVTVDGDDPLYRDLRRWLIEQVPPQQHRSLAARSSDTADRRDSIDTPKPASPRGRGFARRTEVSFLLDSAVAQTINVGGHRVRVAIAVKGPTGNKGDEDAGWNVYDKLTFTCPSREGLEAVRGLLRELAEKRSMGEHRPQLFQVGRWGGFDTRDDLPARSLATVVLREGQAERLVADLADFYSREESYNRLGVPYHRGILLHGPPGTGKTSVAKALADHFRLDLYYVPLSDITKDADLLGLVSNVKAGAMLLLEDIDVLHAAKHRDDDADAQKRVSMSGLLNALDGVGTPQGLVSVLTTNDLGSLDPALIRPGRVDRIEEIGYLDEHQIRRLFEVFYDATYHLPRCVPDLKVAPAEVVEVFKRHWDDAGAAADAVNRILRDRYHQPVKTR